MTIASMASTASLKDICGSLMLKRDCCCLGTCKKSNLISNDRMYIRAFQNLKIHLLLSALFQMGIFSGFLFFSELRKILKDVKNFFPN